MKNLNIKSQSVILITLLIFTFSCNKENSISDSQIKNIDKLELSNKTISNFVEGGSNDEIKRMLSDYQNYENSLTILNKIREGKKSKKPQFSAAIGGKMDDGVTVKINGTSYSAFENKSWNKQGIEFKEYFGKDVKFEIFSNNKLVETRTIYVPKEIYVKLPSKNLEIGRAGNTFTWEADPNNLSRTVFFYYSIFDKEGNKIYGGIKGIVDDGSHSLDRYISESNVASISFQLIRGNLFSTNINGKKTKFSAICVDYHSYDIN